jgi:hypothetical protein
LVVAASIAGAAFAQDKFDFSVANIEILRDKGAQKDIGITEGQLKTLNGYADKFSKTTKAKSDEYQKAKKKPDAAWQKFFTGEYITLRTNVLKSLSPGQLKRLREITIQAAGPRAIMDKQVALKVGLTEADHKKIVAAIIEGDKKVAKIKQEIGAKVGPKYKDKKPKTKEEADKLQKQLNDDLGKEMSKRSNEINAIAKAQDGKVKAIVKEVHLKRLQDLMGKPFKPSAPPATKK